nr:MAG TPA: hypothetical protein [Caudoviricetes sp.]
MFKYFFYNFAALLYCYRFVLGYFLNLLFN